MYDTDLDAERGHICPPCSFGNSTPAPGCEHTAHSALTHVTSKMKEYSNGAIGAKATNRMLKNVPYRDRIVSRIFVGVQFAYAREQPQRNFSEFIDHRSLSAMEFLAKLLPLKILLMLH